MIRAVVHRLILLFALCGSPLLAIEACDIVRTSELIVVGKLNDVKVVAGFEHVTIHGSLHVAGVVIGDLPAGGRIEYVFHCPGCPRPTDRSLELLTANYGLWFLKRRSSLWGTNWTSAHRLVGSPGYKHLGQFEGYKNCLQGRRFSHGNWRDASR